MNAFARWVERHPVCSVLALIALFGLAGSLDRAAERYDEAYRYGLLDASATAPTAAEQLRAICAQPWPDVPGAEEARARACQER